MSEPASIDAAVPAAPARSRPAAGAVRSFLLPSIADWVFAAVMVWLFFGARGAQSLLADGDAGWHIRTGESILATGRLPATDPFSFTMEGRVWFAWEWLADVVLALAHQAGGLQAVVLLAGAVIAATAALTLRYMLWYGVNVFLAVFGTMLVCGVSTMHWLARPHMFTWGFLLATLWLLESDRRKPSRRVWWLVPMTAVWVNTHGGFVAAIVCAAIFAAGGALEELWAAREREEGFRWFVPASARRYGLLTAACAAATLANPWGWQLHVHVAAYLQSDFILKYVEEFQSPNFRGEAMRLLEGTMLVSAVVCGRMLWRGEFVWPLLTLAWAHASLTSVRHAPLFMLVAAPVMLREFTLLLEEGARRGDAWLKTIEEIARDYGGGKIGERTASETGLPLASWLAPAAVIAVALTMSARQDREEWRAEFPGVRFPAAAFEAVGERLAEKRTLTTDQWGDYLIYRLYPRYRTFIDGRSDFYAPRVRDDYLALMGAKWSWETTLERYGFEAALLPLDWPLAGMLKSRPEWRLLYDDGKTLYFERAEAGTERLETGGAAAGAAAP